MIDTFFNILRKGLVGTIALVFAFVVVYSPHMFSDLTHQDEQPETNVTEAFFGTDILNLVQNTISAVATLGLHTKEFLLDGLAWAIAKSIVSSMVASLIDWINHGFKGSPSFVQDFDKFLLQAADRGAGEYIDSLGGLGSFICSPFKLDIQIALSIKYQTARERKPASTCTLSGIKNNLEDFVNGVVTGNSWDDWIKVTSNPEKYTPYGQLLEAEAGMRITLAGVNMKNTEEVRWGGGFISGKICEMVEGPTKPKETCRISKPGKIVQDALSFNLDSGRQSLITADEFNELIAALLGQLANKALSGAAGLLGLSAGTGYTDSGYSGGSFTGALATEKITPAGVPTGSADPNTSTGQQVTSVVTKELNELKAELKVQTDYSALATNYAPKLLATSKNPNVATSTRDTARFEYGIASKAITDLAPTITKLTNLVNKYTPLATEYDIATTTQARKEEIRILIDAMIAEYQTIKTFKTKQDLDYSANLWRSLTGA